MSISLKQKLSLIIIGSSLGIFLLAIIYLIFPNLFTELALPSGAKFETVQDFRAALTQHDSRDTLSDGSVSLRSIVQPNSSDSIIYELKPNLSVKFQHVNVTTNSFGMRGPETTIEKPKDTYRIALMGDSYTFGWAVDQDKTFSALMEKNINKILSDKNSPRKVEVLNFGVPGYATFQEVAAFYDKALKFHPDAVAFYIVSNDFGLPFFIRDVETHTSLVQATEFHSKKIEATDTEALKHQDDMYKSLDGNQPLLKLSEFLKDKHIPIFLIFHPDHSQAKTMNLFWALKNQETKKDFNVIDMLDDYKSAVAAKEVPQDSLRIPRDNHPGAGAHQIIGRILGERFSDYVLNQTKLN